MIRLIILAIVGYVAYRALRSWMFPRESSSESVAGKGVREIDDVMIQDPHCNVYFPQRKAVHLNFEGKDLQFCSTRCRDEFLAAHLEKKEP